MARTHRSAPYMPYRPFRRASGWAPVCRAGAAHPRYPSTSAKFALPACHGRSTGETIVQPRPAILPGAVTRRDPAMLRVGTSADTPARPPPLYAAPPAFANRALGRQSRRAGRPWPVAAWTTWAKVFAILRQPPAPRCPGHADIRIPVREGQASACLRQRQSGIGRGAPGRTPPGSSPDISHCRGCWLGHCRAKGFSRLANTPSIGGGAKTPCRDNDLRHHPATV
jgi:hypothetical protein